MTATALRQWHITVWGAPRTKKTSNQFVIAGGRRLMMPSKAWQQWTKNATVCGDGLMVGGQRSDIWKDPREASIQFNCRAHFYRDARRGDAVGYYQGLADLLEKRGVIANDSQIVSWDGSRLFVDKEHPRVEVTLEEIR